jgi:hypothetical protein
LRPAGADGTTTYMGPTTTNLDISLPADLAESVSLDVWQELLCCSTLREIDARLRATGVVKLGRRAALTGAVLKAQQAAGLSASERADLEPQAGPPDMGHPDPPHSRTARRYRAVHRPCVSVRAAPSIEAQQLGRKWPGETFEIAAEGTAACLEPGLVVQYG